ncbi:hypothetical protein UY3_16166 [Chelonia mydas]|uniref:Uncharacterized protein n=1 Tax=Chelonia mydas TaxID=8469 RepID=M7ANF5_CHEMY|nr:hypothetical protein UY3_16166 [Chelonia mydas]
MLIPIGEEELYRAQQAASGGNQSLSRADSSRAMAEGGEGGEDEIQFLRTGTNAAAAAVSSPHNWLPIQGSGTCC